MLSPVNVEDKSRWLELIEERRLDVEDLEGLVRRASKSGKLPHEVALLIVDVDSPSYESFKAGCPDSDSYMRDGKPAPILMIVARESVVRDIRGSIGKEPNGTTGDVEGQRLLSDLEDMKKNTLSLPMMLLAGGGTVMIPLLWSLEKGAMN